MSSRFGGDPSSRLKALRMVGERLRLVDPWTATLDIQPGHRGQARMLPAASRRALLIRSRSRVGRISIARCSTEHPLPMPRVVTPVNEAAVALGGPLRRRNAGSTMKRAAGLQEGGLVGT